MLDPARPLSAAAGLAHPSLLGGVIAVLLLVLTGASFFLLLRTPRRFRRHGAPWWRQAAIGAVGGALAGGAVLLVTARHTIPHTNAPTWIVRIAVMIAFVGLGLLVSNLRRTQVVRKLLATGTAAVLILVTAVAVNIDRVDSSQPTAMSATTSAPTAASSPPTRAATPAPTLSGSVKPTPDLAQADYAVATSLYRTWKPPAGMPTQGRMESVDIPGTVSRFAARPAEVYLPPAALVAHPPALPVLILLSGQPASPLFVIERGHALATLNTLAARNRGLAPILVVPDQLGQPQINPMCVNSRLGNVATYIMTDVTGWIRSHLNVLSDRDAWAIGGFSEGGTCSIQFASAHPDVFGSFIDVSGERYPTLDSDADALHDAFSGSTTLYDEAKPENIMAAHGPYADTLAVFAVGANDQHYGAIMPIMSAAAASHGIHVARYISPGTGHDWTTASNGFASGIGVLYERFGLAATGQYTAQYTPQN